MADGDSQAAGATLADPQAQAIIHDPLPESTWFYRRCFVFAITAVSVLGVWLMVQSIRDITAAQPGLATSAFVKIIGWLLLFDWCAMTYYLIAPTGEQITRWVQTAGMIKSGVGILSSASVTSEGTTAQTSTAVGQPPSAPLPMEPAPEIDAAPTAR